MRTTFLAAMLATVTGVAAEAADITVGLRKLADEWTAQTGNKVTITGANVGRILTSVNDNAPADLVLLPPDNLKEIAAKLKPGTTVTIGHALFGMAVKAGGEKPDISTVAKFAVVLKQVGEVGYPDPLVGSLSGAMVADMLKRPEFSGVTPKPQRANAATIVKNGMTKFSGGVIAEEITDAGAELVGLFPASLGLRIDLSIAELTYSAAPAEATAFLRYVTRPGATTIWHGCGIEMNDAVVHTPRMTCLIAPPPAPPRP
jgi:molybdate transport system substrate-binding protein